ncbi:MAG: Cd(II)/Pb(II)-responsive transcriptional regulator [Rhodocyclaceae bacterium]|nr:Cd(II)/Pb(II)-responsive transcriptional regulator [Rhodocyclaceae bacterium]
MRIGELAQMGQCTEQTVRYYEKKGLLPAAARTEANYRIYDSAHVERLRFIRNCRALDMTHEEIRGLLDLMEQPASDCGGVNGLLDEHIAHVDARITELAALKRQLAGLRERCQSNQAVNECGILEGLASMETEPRRAPQSHLG